MFNVVVMPLSEFLAGEEDDYEMGSELLDVIQETLSVELDRPVAWDEEPREEGAEDAEELDDEALWALRVVAAWFERRGSLEGCEPGDEPYEHPILDEIADHEGSKMFPQLLHTDVDALAYVPVELDDVSFVTLGDEESMEAAGEDGEVEGEDYGIGSLPRLMEELELLREPLGLPDRLEDIAVEEFVDDPDIPLSSAKFAWYVLQDCARVAEEANLPLLVLWGEIVEEDE